MYKPYEQVRQSLNNKLYGKISNRMLCQFMKISEATFYRLYHERCSAFEVLLEYVVKNSLTLEENDNFEIFIFRALKRIENDKYLYLNIYYSINEDEKRRLAKKLRLVSRNCLKNYCDEHEGISKKNLDAYAALVYSNVYSWVVHGCRQSVSEIYQQLAVSVPAFEGHRCSYKRKYQK